MYCPARYCSRSFAGSLSETIATSSATLSILSTRHGSFRIWMSPARRTSRTSIVSGEFDLALEYLPLARPAGAVAAAVRNHQIGTHRRGEHGLALVACEGVPAGFYGNLERHCSLLRVRAKVRVRDPGSVDRLRRHRLARRRAAARKGLPLRPYPAAGGRSQAEAARHIADRR